MNKITFNKLPLIYVASPYTAKGFPKELKKTIERQRASLITKIIGQLQDKHEAAFIGPITQSHHTAKHMDSKTEKFACWRDIDLTYISHCEQVWVVTMNGWDKSTGVLAEIAFAEQEDIPVFFIDPKTLKKTSHDPILRIPSCS